MSQLSQYTPEFLKTLWSLSSHWLGALHSLSPLESLPTISFAWKLLLAHQESAQGTPPKCQTSGSLLSPPRAFCAAAVLPSPRATVWGGKPPTECHRQLSSLLKWDGKEGGRKTSAENLAAFSPDSCNNISCFPSHEFCTVTTDDDFMLMATSSGTEKLT